MPCCSESCDAQKSERQWVSNTRRDRGRRSWPHRANLELIALKVLLCQRGEQENDLSLDNRMDVRVAAGRVVHLVNEDRCPAQSGSRARERRHRFGGGVLGRGCGRRRSTVQGRNKAGYHPPQLYVRALTPIPNAKIPRPSLMYPRIATQQGYNAFYISGYIVEYPRAQCTGRKRSTRQVAPHESTVYRCMRP